MKRNVDNEKRAGFLRRTAKEVKRYKVVKRMLIVASILLCTLLGSTYAVSALYKKTGSFTVGLNKYEMTKYGLSLSETRDLQYLSATLNADIVEDITNIAEATLPDNLDQIDGEHNGENYIAYTFYLQNAGDVQTSCQYDVVMTNISNDLDEAIRLRLYVDGEATTYAKTRSDGGGAEIGTEPFYSANIMASGRIDDLAPTESVRFTVVIWIEGNDPDCVDWLIGGKMKIDMKIAVVA